MFFTSGQKLYEDDLSSSGSGLTQSVMRISGDALNPEVQGVARISEDGSHIYFVAKGVLSNAANSIGDTATEGLDNLYVFSEGHTSFIATLSPSDEGSDWMRPDERLVQASEDGDLLVFVSQEDLTHEGVIPGKDQVFAYDTQTRTLVRASIGQDDYNNNNRTPANDSVVDTRPSAANAYSNNDSPTQADGLLAPQNGAVFFTSPDALTPQALNDRANTLGQLVPNIYEYRAGHVYLISDGRDDSTLHESPGVSLLGSDLNGDNVFFTTSDSLVSPDTNNQQDIYDARVEGGVIAATTLPACTGEGCHGGLSAALGLPTPASNTQQAEVSTKPPASEAKAKPKAKSKLKIKRKTKRKRRKARATGHGAHGRMGGRSEIR